MQTLPQTSDALRGEARVLREAADRVAGQMEASVEAVRAGHHRIRMLEKALHEIIGLDHHNHGPESRATTIARSALNQQNGKT